jgi:hypothetical protein
VVCYIAYDSGYKYNLYDLSINRRAFELVGLSEISNYATVYRRSRRRRQRGEIIMLIRIRRRKGRMKQE